MGKDLNNYFFGKKAYLATMHKKEAVIAPVLESLGIDVYVVPDFDSDAYGTFTGDIERKGSQVDAVLAKAHAAMKITGENIVIASEGSFNSDSVLPIAINREIVVYKDKIHGIICYGHYVSPAPFAFSVEARSIDDVTALLKNVNIKSQAMVVRTGKNDSKKMIKGIRDEQELMRTATTYLDAYGSVWIEADLRAHMSNTRMSHIEKATQNLLENLKRQCPGCDLPGFSIESYIPGLPCEQCGTETSQPLAARYCCNVCETTRVDTYPYGIMVADASRCSFCNP